MSDTFAVEVFDPSLLITNLGKFERVVPGDRIGRCENFSYIGGDEGWSGDEQHSENEKPEPQSSPSSSEKRISNKHTLIYRMFHVTPNLQPSGKPFSPKQQGRSSEEGGGGGRFEHGGRWSGDNTKMRVREGSHLNPGGELVQNRQHGILRVLGNYVESGQNGPSSPPSSSSVEIGPAGSSQEFLAAVVNPTVKLKGREGLHHSRSEGELLSKDLVVTTKVKSSDPAFPKHYPTESSPTTRRFSSGSKNVNNNNASEPESPHKPNSPSHQHNIFYRMFYEHHDGENHTKKINNNNHPTNSSSTPKSSRRLSINNKHHGGGDHHPVQHHSIFKDLIETGNKVKRSRSLDKIGKLTRSQSDASLSEKYGECQEVLGKGAHAVVQLAHKKDTFCREKLYAVKRFRKRPKDEHPKEHIKKLTAEFCIASTLHHENVCETVDLIQDENENWCEVMEYCPGGDLYTRIKAGPMNQLEIDCFFKQLIHGLAYIHSMGVAHRDIKPENLLLDASGHILKIADFGVSVVFRTLCEKTYRKSKGLCGSEPYIACEEFTVREYHPGPVDLWAAAVVYYTMVYRAIPWIRAEISRDPRYAAYREATTIMEQFDAKSANPIEETPSTEKTDSVVVPLVITTPRRDPFSRLSLGASNVICHMLKSDPEKRWTAQDVKRDSWFAAVECCYECHWNDHHGHTEVDEGNGHI